MLDFVFTAPTEFIFGRDADSDVASTIKKYGGTKVLVHYGGGSVKKNGILDKITSSLNDRGIPYVELGGVVPNPESSLVYKGIELCKNEDVDFILAVGGGSVIDSSKAIAAGVKYDGDFLDFYKKGVVVKDALPLGVVLTIAAAGSEGNGDSVITDVEDMSKRVTMSEALRPKFSVLNPENTLSLPPYQTACGITDIMAHVCERYFTHTTDVEITDRLCEGVLKAVIEEAPKVMNNLNDYEARANIMWSGVVAHNNTCGVGRAQDWSSHAMEHELSSLYGVAHGAGLAVIMPAWMTFVMSRNVKRFSQFATRVWGCEMNEANPEVTAKAGIECFRNFLKSLCMPGNFKELGANKDDIPEMIKRLGVTETNTIGEFVKIGPVEAKRIYEIAAEF